MPSQVGIKYLFENKSSIYVCLLSIKAYKEQVSFVTFTMGLFQ